MVIDCRAEDNDGDDDDDDDYVGPDLWEAVRSNSDVFQQPLPVHFVNSMNYMDRKRM